MGRGEGVVRNEHIIFCPMQVTHVLMEQGESDHCVLTLWGNSAQFFYKKFPTSSCSNYTTEEEEKQIKIFFV